MSDPILRICYVHLDHEGVVLSTGTMPTTVPRESLAASGRLEVTEQVYAQLQQPGRWSLSDGMPVLLPPEDSDTRRVALGQRARLLSGSDWTQVADVPYGPEWQEAWRAYRQQLRDVSSQPGFPQVIEWPAPPPTKPDVAAAAVPPSPEPPYVPPAMPS